MEKRTFRLSENTTHTIYKTPSGIGVFIGHKVYLRKGIFLPNGELKRYYWRKGENIYFSFRRGRLDIYRRIYKTRNRTSLIRSSTWTTMRDISVYDYQLKSNIPTQYSSDLSAYTSYLTEALKDRAKEMGVRTPSRQVSATILCMYMAYPILASMIDAGELNISGKYLPPIPRSTSTALRAENNNDMTFRLLGLRGKSLARRIRNLIAEHLSMDHYNNGIIHIHYAIGMLSQLRFKNRSFVNFILNNLTQCKNNFYIDYIPRKAIRNFLAQNESRWHWILDHSFLDIFRMQEQLEAIDVEYKNPWKKCNALEYHDYLSRLHRRSMQRDIGINIEDKLVNIEKTFTVADNKLKIRFPRSTHELVNWGEKMKNCISSYATSILAGRTTCFALIDENDAIHFNGEFTQGKLTQLSGKYNTPAPTELFKETERIFSEKMK